MSQRRHITWWPFISLIPLGLGAWAPIYAGVRARYRPWTMLGVLWSAIVVLGFVLNGVDGKAGHDDLAGACLIVGWCGAAASSFVIRRAFEQRIALGLDQADPSAFDHAEVAAERRLHDREHARRIVRENPALALEMGIGRPDRPGGADGGLVDVNHASAHELTSLPGVDEDLAERIVATRREVHTFSSIEDLGTVMDLDGRLVEGLRDAAIFIAAPQDPER
ncbi:MAG TPA: helix-hairpin-helix domain-containing protein [Solirubrobacteraceae bacterium]|nr:helix-hairpin-helix domain-containing protein [Solirubrobacteraceae bacterium]